MKAAGKTSRRADDEAATSRPLIYSNETPGQRPGFSLRIANVVAAYMARESGVRLTLIVCFLGRFNPKQQPGPIANDVSI